MTEPQPMTAAELAECKAREEKATAGPWYSHNTDDRYRMNAFAITTDPVEPVIDGESDYDNTYEHVVALTLLQTPRLACHEAGRWHWDAEFIANARTDVPRLLATVEAQAKRIAELEKDVHQCRLYGYVTDAEAMEASKQ